MTCFLNAAILGISGLPIWVKIQWLPNQLLDNEFLLRIILKVTERLHKWFGQIHHFPVFLWLCEIQMSPDYQFFVELRHSQVSKEFKFVLLWLKYKKCCWEQLALDLVPDDLYSIRQLHQKSIFWNLWVLDCQCSTRKPSLKKWTCVFKAAKLGRLSGIFRVKEEPIFEWRRIIQLSD